MTNAEKQGIFWTIMAAALVAYMKLEKFVHKIKSRTPAY